MSLHFRKHQDVRDPRVVEMLVSLGDMELRETLNQWKQQSHVLAYLEPDEKKQSTEAIQGDPCEDPNYFDLFVEGRLPSRW